MTLTVHVPPKAERVEEQKLDTVKSVAFVPIADTAPKVRAVAELFVIVKLWSAVVAPTPTEPKS